MNSQALKEAIGADIETIQSMSVEIIPAREYYSKLFKLVIGGIWKLGLIAFLAIVFSSINDSSHPLIGRNAYVETIVESAIIAFFMAMAAMIMLLPAMTHYYLIRHYLQHRLKTGEMLVKKLKQTAYLFWGAFTLFCLMFASYVESAAIFFMVGLAFMMSAAVIYFAVSLEINRIGFSLLFTAISQFFNKDKAKGKAGHA